jgi:hypothetical protein
MAQDAPDRSTITASKSLPPITPDDELHDLLVRLLVLTARQMRRRALPIPTMCIEL